MSYSEHETYSETSYIHNPGIFKIRSMFRTLCNTKEQQLLSLDVVAVFQAPPPESNPFTPTSLTEVGVFTHVLALE